jgi:RNA polymerase sigma factor (sigma-70 family)
MVPAVGSPPGAQLFRCYGSSTPEGRPDAARLASPMEASALQNAAAPALVGRSPLLRLQADEKLVALIRRGHHGAFEALVNRYESRLLSFCRHMLGSTEDAEDVLQEVFAAAFNAICADERPINARPWLYRIARNRCLNHLRRPVHSGQDSMDIFERDGGQSTADTVHRREEFRRIVADVQDLPETQRTALLLREIDALSYEQIAEAMDTTVPSIKSLLVRARVSLAEAAEARLLTCEEVRLELGQVAEGLLKSSAPARRHLKGCDRCRLFKGELRKSTRALAAIYPIGPLVILKKLLVTKLGGSLGGGSLAGGSAGAAGGSAGVASSAGVVGGSAGIAGGSAGVAGGSTGVAAGLGAGGSSVAGAGAGGLLSVGGGTLATKAAAGFVAAAIVTAGAVEVKHVSERSDRSSAVATEVTDPKPNEGAMSPLGGTGHPASPATAEQAGSLTEESLKAILAAGGDPSATEPSAPGETDRQPGDAQATVPAGGAEGTHPAGTVPHAGAGGPATREEHGSATTSLVPHPPPTEGQTSLSEESAGGSVDGADSGEDDADRPSGDDGGRASDGDGRGDEAVDDVVDRVASTLP